MTYKNELRIARAIASTILHATTTRDERILERWLRENSRNREIYDKLTGVEFLETILSHRQPDMDEVITAISARISYDPRNFQRRRRRRLFASVAAACLAAVAALSTLWLAGDSVATDELIERPSKVRLVLASGEEIFLDDPDLTGELRAGSFMISRTGTGLDLTTYQTVLPETDHPAQAFNRIITEKGGEIFFRLPDGTSVWLNADSEFGFPASFTGQERRVTIQGEGYFEVAADRSRPFVVETRDMNVRVLGTSFNLKAYPTDVTVAATLLSGSVGIETAGKTYPLNPGSTAVFDRNTSRLSISEADTEAVLAWRDGYFIFRDEGLHTVMKTLERWYDIVFGFDTGELKHHTFNGSLNKYDSLGEILEMIRLAGGPELIIRNDTLYVK